MSKRQISKQQATRIARLQQQYAQQTGASAQEGLVVTRFGKHAAVENTEGRIVHCDLRPHVPDIVAGDRVLWEMAHDERGVVVSCLPRTSVLEKPAPRGVLKPVAANVTQLVVVIASQPAPSWLLVDSYLVLAAMLDIAVCLVLNKTDLYCKDEQAFLGYYATLGFPSVEMSRDIPIEALAAKLSHAVSVVVGQSGVGKSSLILRLLPEQANIETGAISERTGFGKHTTSRSCYYHLPAGGALIDSPGVREFGVTRVSESALGKAFPEFSPAFGHCRFRDCNHDSTPGCAIVAEISKNSLVDKRYDNFLTLHARMSR